MRDFGGCQDFARLGPCAQPGRQVQRPAAVALFDLDRFAHVEPDADWQRQLGVPTCFVDVPLLECNGSA